VHTLCTSLLLHLAIIHFPGALNYANSSSIVLPESNYVAQWNCGNFISPVCGYASVEKQKGHYAAEVASGFYRNQPSSMNSIAWRDSRERDDKIDKISSSIVESPVSGTHVLTSMINLRKWILIDAAMTCQQGKVTHEKVSHHSCRLPSRLRPYRIR